MSSFTKESIVPLLQTIGLDKKEASVYLACLNATPVSPTVIARQVGLKRSTAYFYLDRLVQKKLIAFSIKGKRKLIVATPPASALSALLSAKEVKMNQEKKALQKLLPLLIRLLPERVDATQVYLYRGNASVRTIADTLLRENADNYWFGTVDNFTDVVSDESIYRQFTVPRMQQKTTGYGITDRRVLTKKRANELLGGFRKFRFVDHNINLPTGYMICGRYTVIAVKRNNDVTFIMIKDALVAELLRMAFKLLWERLPEPSPSGR